MAYVDFIVKLHAGTKRDYLERVVQHDKAKCAEVAIQYGKDYWDGDRMYGFGGYKYDGRWLPVAEDMARHYGLKPGDKILDVGCGKGFLLYEFTQAIPGVIVAGIDISKYAIDNAKEEVKPFLQVGNALNLPFEDDSFDLVISINTVHNLPLEECKRSLREIQRVARNHAFIVVDSWRSDEEKEAMEAWNLTAETYMLTSHWEALFAEVGYTRDYYWFIP